MRVLYRFSLRRPRTVVLAALLLTAGVAPGVLRLTLRTDGHALVPLDAPEIQHDGAIREAFGLDDPVVVVVHANHPQGLFNARTIALVDRLTTAFSALPDVRPAGVFSLTTEHGDRVFPGTLRFRRFLDPLPKTDTELATARKDFSDVRLYNGTLLSKDLQSTAIMVGVPPNVNRAAFFTRVRAVLAAEPSVPETIEVIGAPVAEALLGTHILQDLGVPDSWLGDYAMPSAGRWIGLVPIAIVIMALVFAVRFRSVTAAALPMMEVGACLVVTFALMGWLGVPVYLTTTVMPIILTATGITDEIHVFGHYRRKLAEQPGQSHLDILHATLDEMFRPVVMASLTTAVGFLSFAVSSIAPVRAFGLFTAFGIVFCMIWSLTVIPAMLCLVDPRRFMSKSGTDAAAGPLDGRLFSILGRGVVRFRWWVILGFAGVVACSPLGIRRVVVQDSWIDGFAPGSSFREAMEAFNDQFLGAHILYVCVDAGHERLATEVPADAIGVKSIRLPGDLVPDPSYLVGRRLRLVKLGDYPFVGPPSRSDELRRVWYSWIQAAERDGDAIVVYHEPRHGSPAAALQLDKKSVARVEILTWPLVKPDVLRQISRLEDFIEQHKNEAVGGVLGTADYIAAVSYLSRGRKEADRAIPDNADRIEWLWGEYERIRGVEHRRQLLDDDKGRSILTVLMKDANFVGTARLMRAIRDYEARELAPHGISLSFAGDVAVSQTLIDAIVGTQVASVLGSLLGDFLITAILGRSVVFGLLCILPSAIAVLVNFAVMGWIGMPLGVATSMFSAMTLGVGVDYAIHLLERYRMLKARGQNVREALAESVSQTGSSISVDTLAVCLGFGVLVFSQVPANARLGVLLSLSLSVCLLTTLTVLPAMISVRRLKPSRL